MPRNPGAHGPDGSAATRRSVRRVLGRAPARAWRGCSGNFDTQVDYRLKAWPENNGVNVNFSVGNRTLFRHNGPGSNDWLSSYFPPFAGGQVIDAEPTGSLRFVRTGSVVRGYYRDDVGDWNQLDSAPIHAGPRERKPVDLYNPFPRRGAGRPGGVRQLPRHARGHHVPVTVRPAGSAT